MALGDQQQGSLKIKRSNSYSSDGNGEHSGVVEAAQSPGSTIDLAAETAMQLGQYTHQELDTAQSLVLLQSGGYLREQVVQTGSEAAKATPTEEDKAKQKASSDDTVPEETDSQATVSEEEIERDDLAEQDEQSQRDEEAARSLLAVRYETRRF
ncbi:MAG: hypothetical protein Q9228_004623 [Teloschistes exilis]